MSTTIYGIVPPDEKWKQMKAIWDACVDADVAIPESVIEFFHDEEPDEKGVLINLDEEGVVYGWSGDMSAGYEINVADLPEHVTIIRIVHSY